MFISQAFAQTPGGPGGIQGIIGNPLFMIVLMFIIFYFLLIRPQQKRLKDHQAMIAAVSRGDVVVTAGGLVGKVARVDDDELEIELGEGVRVKAIRATISDVRGKTEPAKATPAKADKKADAKK